MLVIQAKEDIQKIGIVKNALDESCKMNRECPKLHVIYVTLGKMGARRETGSSSRMREKFGSKMQRGASVRVPAGKQDDNFQELHSIQQEITYME